MNLQMSDLHIEWQSRDTCKALSSGNEQLPVCENKAQLSFHHHMPWPGVADTQARLPWISLTPEAVKWLAFEGLTPIDSILHPNTHSN